MRIRSLTPLALIIGATLCSPVQAAATTPATHLVAVARLAGCLQQPGLPQSRQRQPGEPAAVAGRSQGAGDYA